LHLIPQERKDHQNFAQDTDKLKERTFDPDGNQIEVPFKIPRREDIDLENHCDDHFGYLLMQAGPNKLSGEYHIVSHPWESWCKKSQKIDRFDLDLQTHQLVRSTIKPHV